MTLHIIDDFFSRDLEIPNNYVEPEIKKNFLKMIKDVIEYKKQNSESKSL